MTAATLGGFLRPASDHIAAAARFQPADLRASSALAAARQAQRVVAVMSHYLGDVTPYGDYEAAASPDMEPLMRTAADMRQALEMAAGSLDHAVPDPGSVGAAPEDPLAACLAAAGTSLAAGRDLLVTHFATGADGIRAGESQWSTAIVSPPVTRALLEEISRWSQQLALLAATLTSAAAVDPATPATVLQGLGGACQWLLSASAAFEEGQHDDPAAQAGAELLEAIPANSVPQRRPPAEDERATRLCEGVTVSAGRLRVIARRTAGQAAWSPAATAASWRWTAKAAAVTSHLSELILRSLAERPEHLAGITPAAQLHTAAEAAARACARWREVAVSWKQMTTETRGLSAPVIADASDLVLRLGRLASGDPKWTPSQPVSAGLQNPSELAPGPARAAMIAAAVHEAVDALACVAAADLHAVGTACTAGRVYAPTSTLPEDYDVPRPFGNPAPVTVAILLDAYREAEHASIQAVTAMDAVAVTLHTPSRMLAAARAATAPAEGSSPRHQGGIQPGGPAQTLPDLKDAAGRRQPGPVEQAVRRLAVPDPVLVLRAAAIDKAARKLVAEAEQSSSRRRAARQEEDPARPGRAGRTAARVAAESFPHEPPATTARQQTASPPRPAGPRNPHRPPSEGR